MKIFLKSVKEGMYFFSELISNIVNITLLFLVYFTILGLTAVIAKLVGKKFLLINLKKWMNINQQQKKESYFRQF